MASKRSPRRPPQTRAVTSERTARLYRLLHLLSAGPQTRDALTRQLRCDVRSFYRDLQLLRGIGFHIPLCNQRYALEGELTEAVAARMPFPDPNLTLAEAQQLAKGTTAAHRKLREEIQRILPSSGKKAARGRVKRDRRSSISYLRDTTIMILSWLRRRRRQRLLAQPFPAGWLPYLQKNVAHYCHLSPTEQARIRDDLRVFVAEKTWEGCGGLAITDEIKVTIAAQAMLLVLGLEHNYFDRVLSILVYPHGYEGMGQEANGVISEGQGLLGTSVRRGPVILAWSEVVKNARHPERGHNLVYHEFAHQLDMLDGVINGTPPLKDGGQRQRWHDVMTAEYNALVEASVEGRATLIDHYGATNEGEFFAVATECFFDKPVEMARRHPKLYDLLCEYYRQDPAKRCGHLG